MSKGRQAAIERVRHMIAAADAIARYVARGRDAYESDSAVREAIIYQIIIIGEAAKAVTAIDPTIVTAFSGVEWSLLARMRDKITHQYWAVDREVVWSTATRDIPAIRATLAPVADAT